MSTTSTETLAAPAQTSGLRKAASYRPDIDGLRALAVLSVVLFHGGVPFLKGGYVGVDVFFVISGYLISSHIYRDLQRNTFTLRAFYERRARRILPALLAVILVCTLAGCILFSPRELAVLAAHVITAVTSTSNIFFWLRTDYFAPHAELKPLLMTWSLGVEEQFYLIFPLLLGFLWRHGKRGLLFLLGGFSLLSFAVAVFQVSHHQTASFYLLPSRWWELGLGTILGIYEANHNGGDASPSRAWTNELFGAVGLIALLGSVFFFGSETPFPGLAALVPVGASIMLLSSPRSWVNRRVLSQKVLVGIGLVSYSLYLWHWPVLSFANFISGDVIAPFQMGCLLCLALLLAVVSYFCVEQPFRHARLTPRTLGLYGVACVACCIPSGLLLASQGWPSRYPVAASVEQKMREPSNQTCLAQDGQVAPIHNSFCTPSANGKPIFAVMGDSHASSLNRYVRSAAQAKGWAVAEYTKGSCPQLGLVAPNYFRREECEAYNQKALAEVIRDQHVKTVLVAGYWLARFPPNSYQGRYVAEGQDPALVTVEDSWKNLQFGLNDSVSRLKSGGKAVFLVADSPNLDFQPGLLSLSNAIAPRRFLAGMLRNGDIASGIAPFPKSQTEFRVESILKSVAVANGVGLIDLYTSLCDTQTCRYLLNGQPVFEDSQHITRAGAEFALRDSSFIWEH